MRVRALLLGCCLAARANALEWQGGLDARLVASDGARSFLDGGLGKLRYDSAHEGWRWGRLQLDLTQDIGQTWSARFSASSWVDHDKTPVDVTEAYLLYRPYAQSVWRKRLRIGALYAPVSLENRASGWSSPYTISDSAINSWVGEELRTVGAEAELSWAGSKIGHASDLTMTAGVFGWNDPAGVLIAAHGFSLHDRQTGLFGSVGLKGGGPVHGNLLFREIDGRAGYYTGAAWRWHDRLELRALRYDNCADDTRFNAAINDFAWATRFDALGVRFETDSGWTAVAQALAGATRIHEIEPQFDERYRWRFHSAFALLSRRIGPQRLSLRRDEFDTHLLPRGLSEDHGHAWTAAYGYEPNERWRFMVEWLRVSSSNSARPALYGGDARIAETQLQLSLRYRREGSW